MSSAISSTAPFTAIGIRTLASAPLLAGLLLLLRPARR
jgi:hypothetical protein